MTNLEDLKPSFQLDQVIPKLQTLRVNPGVVLVAIDGRGGAGKSTLARQLHDEIGARVIGGDDFYRVMNETERRSLECQEAYMKYVDWERLRAHVLEPLRNGKAARFERYDWNRNELVPVAKRRKFAVLFFSHIYTPLFWPQI